jgi:S-adenosylmethionine hydrolase
MKFKNQYFISNDNGFFGAFLDEHKPQELWRYNINANNIEEIKFPLKNCFVQIAEKIHKGVDINTFADSVQSYKKAFIPKALIEEFIIRGVVIHVDSFGNLITNITKQDFERYPADAPFTIRFHNDYFIDVISETYNQVQAGEKVAIFNENDFLEIAVNRGATTTTGGADKLFGVKTRDLIKIEFNPKGSLKTLF